MSLSLEGSISMSERTTQRSAEVAAVHGLYQQFMDAWNRGSGGDLAAVFTPTATWSASTGRTSRAAR
jgi:hypothetical protein